MSGPYPEVPEDDYPLPVGDVWSIRYRVAGQEYHEVLFGPDGAEISAEEIYEKHDDSGIWFRWAVRLPNPVDPEPAFEWVPDLTLEKAVAAQEECE